MSAGANLSEKPRLASLDALRGADMMWLLGGGPLILHLAAWLAPAWVPAVRFQTGHAPFGAPPQGIHDLVMPLFLFMSGAAMAFSGPWADDAAPRDPRRWIKVVRRTVVLWLVGMAIQGNLLGYDPSRFIWFSNTLQAIAAGGLIAEIVALLPAGRVRIAVFFSLPVVLYAITLSGGGGYDMATSPAIRFEDWAQGTARGDRHYAWILPSLNFGFTVLAGVYAGRRLRRAAGAWRKVAELALAGLASLALSRVAAVFEPNMKHLWTGTFALWSAGWCLGALALFFILVDILAMRRLAAVFLPAGRNALIAYVMVELFRLDPYAKQLTEGLRDSLNPHAFAALDRAVALALAWGVLALLHRHRIYLRV